MRSVFRFYFHLTMKCFVHGICILLLIKKSFQWTFTKEVSSSSRAFGSRASFNENYLDFFDNEETSLDDSGRLFLIRRITFPGMFDMSFKEYRVIYSFCFLTQQFVG